ncbi:SpoIID/LytB domain-containing protein [Cyanobium sp. FGCU-6]|nr:SpoIID/LytB domain-containing protein [Cyanobium sp. FGCU6]
MSFSAAGWRTGLPVVLIAGALLPAMVELAADARPPRRPVPVAAAAAPAADGPPVRVLLRQGDSLEITAASGALRLSDGSGRPVLEVPAWRRLRLALRPAAVVAVVEGAQGAEPPRVLPLAPLWLEPLTQGERPSEAMVALGEQRYRGRLYLRPDGERLQAINVIGVESYLPSVVGSEMPATWPLPALMAQAVAARTYALGQRRPSAPFDLKATVASQVYRGVSAETASTREAVARTRGEVLTYGDALINAVFHSSSGGATENSGEIWSRQLPYLVSVPDFDQRSPVRQWEQRYEPEQLRRAFPETDGVRGIEVLAKSSTGRIRRARIIGPAGALELSGPELRQRLGLRSTMASFQFLPTAAPVVGVPLFAPAAAGSIQGAVGAAGRNDDPPAVAAPSLLVSGRGFGHGVGMSQWGAYGLALKGQGHRQILSHYYPGARLTSWPPR